MTCRWCGLTLPVDDPGPLCECCAADGVTTCQVCGVPTTDGAVCRECGDG